MSERLHPKKRFCLKYHSEFSCRFCNSNFDSTAVLEEHLIEVHFPASAPRRDYPCHICKEKFLSKTELDEHSNHFHSSAAQQLNSYRSRTCHFCGEIFEIHLELQEHLHRYHPDAVQDFPQYGSGGEVFPISLIRDIDSLGAVSVYYADIDEFVCDEAISELNFFQSVKSSTYNIIRRDLKKWKNLKVFFQLNCNFIKEDEEGGVIDFKVGKFTSFAHLIYTVQNIDKIWHLVCHQFSSKIEDFICERSGWILDKIQYFGITTSKYQLTNVGTYIALPYPLTLFKSTLLNIDNCVINIDGRHNKCFAWCVLAHLLNFSLPPAQLKNQDKNRNRWRNDKKVEMYIDHLQKLDLQAIKFPITIEQLPTFEKYNPNISLTVLGYDMDSTESSMCYGTKKTSTKNQKRKNYDFIQQRISILYNSSRMKEIHVDLLCLMTENSYHFVLIRKLEALMRSPTNHQISRICRNCLQNFQSVESLETHQSLCSTVDYQRVKLPHGDHVNLKFAHWERTQPAPFRFYADFEAFLPEYDRNHIEEMERRRMKAEFFGKTVNNKTSKSIRCNIHRACGYSWICIDYEGRRRHGEYYHTTMDGDEDVAYKFVKSIAEYTQVLAAELGTYEQEAKHKLSEVLTTELLEAFKKENKCCFCRIQFTSGEKPVRHHSHLPPYTFIGLSHNQCNIQANIEKKFPVFIHNFGSYDAHFIMQALGKLRTNDIIWGHTCIPKSSEKMLSISLNLPELFSDEDVAQPATTLKFVDSLGFTLKSLSSLVKTMKKDSNAQFEITRQEFSKEVENGADINLLFEKGAYPYSLMKAVHDFNIQRLPPKQDFYNSLTNEAINDDVYEHAQKVWRSFKVSNMGDWHDLYVRLDAALLADIMESIRKIMMDSYQLDLSHYLSLPMMSIDCALKKSGITLELISDPTMHIWIERCIRGGLVSVGSQRAAAANNPYMHHEYDPSKPTSYILYIDANNLYGKAMSSPLPVGGFDWMSDSEVKLISKSFDLFLNNLDDNSSQGYIFEVDFRIDPSLHDKFNDYPPAPSKRTIAKHELSMSYQLPLIEDLGIKDSIFKNEKLIADLCDKKNYILHYAVLKEYVKMGVEVVAIHRILRFRQSAWLKEYIDFNTEMRKKATNDFAKDFWKLLNNSAFGKTIEQVRERMNVQIVTSRQKAMMFNKKPTVRNIIVLNETTCLFMMRKLAVTLNKPIFTGTAILDLAKQIMYDMHYNGIQKIYGGRATLLYTDTDSLIYQIVTEDIYKDMLCHRQLFDMSDYPAAHPDFGSFHDSTNKKVLGKFKDEYAGNVITHIICPRPKMYTIRSIGVVAARDESGETIYEKNANQWMVKEGCSKKVKGITRCAVRDQISYKDFAKVLEENVLTEVTMTGFRSIEHRIFTETIQKKALHGLDTKRFALDPINTVAFGHKDIPLYNN